MGKVNQSTLNSIISKPEISGSELQDLVHYFSSLQEKLFASVKADGIQALNAQQIGFVNLQIWKLLGQIVKVDDIDCLKESLLGANNPSHLKEANPDYWMDIESVEPIQQMASVCKESDEKMQFYSLFLEKWYSKSDTQRMQVHSYDLNRMPNFLCEEKGSTLSNSQGCLASKSYSDLQIIQDIIYFDPLLQRFAKAISWVTQNCLIQEAVDPDVVRQAQIKQSGPKQKESLERFGEVTSSQLIIGCSLLKSGEIDRAHQFFEQKGMAVPNNLLESVFPYHDFLLSDSNDKPRLQQLIMSEKFKQCFLVDIFQNHDYNKIFQERLAYYKENKFSVDLSFNSHFGNVNWIQSLSLSLKASQKKERTRGEKLFFGYLSQSLDKSSIPQTDLTFSWYEGLWATLKYLYTHEVIKRFLVIKELLSDSIEQFYPNSKNFADLQNVGSMKQPGEQYKQLFGNHCLEGDILTELRQYLRLRPSDDKFQVQIQLILAYLQRDHNSSETVILWELFFEELEQRSRNSENNILVLEHHARIAYSLMNSLIFRTIKSEKIRNSYNNIIKNYVQFLIRQDRRSEIIVFLKNLSDEKLIINLMAQYLSEVSSVKDKKDIKQQMVQYGYSEERIQMILRERVTSQSKGQTEERNGWGQAKIDELKLFIENSKDLHLSLQHYLIVARSFLQSEQVQLYASMREDHEISLMIQNYFKAKGADALHLKEKDPFLNELAAYDGLMECYKLLDLIEKAERNSISFKQNQSAPTSVNPEMIKYSKEFIRKCEATFFKQNFLTRKSYLFIDTNVEFNHPKEREFNPHNLTKVVFKELTTFYLKKAMIETMRVALVSGVKLEINSLIGKYFSPDYDAFTYLSFDDQESIIKKATRLLTDKNTQFMKTILNL